ncbi:hypothetical protein [Salinigranum halophilum]|uniref:hypothetical protein n=1 Tax=Salinigranum halophilum TaxID=2565931 RepID=UPI0010A87947|nr:hypothetical protein [Salinigranum halophilum]
MLLSNRQSAHAILVLIITIALVTAPVLGIPNERDKTTEGVGEESTPVQVFLGEKDLNVSQVTLSSGQQVGADRLTLTGIGGEAENELITGPGDAFDFTGGNGALTGQYDADNDGEVDFTVIDAEVTEATLYRTSGATPRTTGANGESIQIKPGENVTLTSEFNFDEATFAEIIVRKFDEEGDKTKITSQVTSSNKLTQSGETRLLDTSSLDEGRYTVEVNAKGLPAKQTLEFFVSDDDPTLTLEQTTVTRGDTVLMELSGVSDEALTVSVSASALEDASSASVDDIFAQTGDRRDAGYDTATDQYWATYDTGETGEVTGRLRTDSFEAGSDVELSLRDSTTSLSSAPIDEVDLGITERSISMSHPERVALGSEIQITGTATQTETVGAYVRVDDSWELLRDADGDSAVDAVDSDGSFSIDADVSTVVDLAEPYALGVKALDSTSNPPTTIETAVFTDDTHVIGNIEVVEGSLSASLSATPLSTEDESVTISGTARGGDDVVRVYVVGPRGAVDYATPSVDNAGAFEAEFGDDFTRVAGAGSPTPDLDGTYRVFVISAGANQRFASEDGTTVPKPGRLQDEQASLIADAYTGAGVDDKSTERTFTAHQPGLYLESFPDTTSVGPVSVSGTATYDEASQVRLVVTDDAGETVTQTTARVDETNQWAATMNVTVPGTYTIRVSEDGREAVGRFSVTGPATSTPDATMTPTATATETPEPSTETAEPTATETEVQSSTPTQTSAVDTSLNTPFLFGVIVVLLGLFARRTRWE